MPEPTRRREPLLPIKVVFPADDDFRKPGGVPHGWEPLVNVTPELRRSFVSQVRDVRAEFAPYFNTFPNMPGVARVTLREKAQAKSYRPDGIFNEESCPIIGGGRAGQLFVAVTPGGLDVVARSLMSTTKEKTAHVSTINRIEPFTPTVDLDQPAKERRRSAALRVRLFDFLSKRVNDEVTEAFTAFTKENGADEVKPLSYAPGLRIYRVDGLPPAGVEKLRGFVGVQSVSSFPLYSVVRTQSIVLGTVTAAMFPPPDPNVNYGVVGVIDTGTDPSNKLLQDWVVARHDKWVPPERQDTSHGSFVAGLIAHGRLLNHNDPRFPTAAARIVDVAAFDKDGRLEEDELLLIIDDALTTFPDVKVWNLSLSRVGDACDDLVISELGAALDARAKQHDVQFVIASGNYRSPPYRPWPSTGKHDDRIRPPADSVRGLTVGGIAHLDTPSTVVRREQPSPFTRCGPASYGIPKPELSHYAGNCDPAGQYKQAGIISVDGQGHITESIGTSYACPIVSTVLANVYRELNTQPGAASVTLAKAALIHSAFVKNGPPAADNIQYRGAGIPADVEEAVHCSQPAATIIMQVDVRPNPLFEKRPFPMPPCLYKSGGLQGDIFMTLLYDCPLDARYNLEYCRNKVRASLGTVTTGGDGTERYDREVYPVPARMNEQYEDTLYEHGYQWSPLKLYFRRFKRGPVQPWRLTLQALNRAEYVTTEPQRVILLVTIRSHNAADLVYDEMVNEMNKLGWATADLQIRSRARQRGHGRGR